MASSMAIGGGEELPEAVKCFQTGDAWIMMIELLEEHALSGRVHTRDAGQGSNGSRIAQQLVQINIKLAGQTSCQPRELPGRILLQGPAVAIGDSEPDQSQRQNTDQGKCQEHLGSEGVQERDTRGGQGSHHCNLGCGAGTRRPPCQIAMR